MKRPVRVQRVEVIRDFMVRLRFTDGTVREVDLEPFLHGPIFEPIRNDRKVFLALKVDDRMKTLVWPNGADIDPDVLYLGLKPAWTATETAAIT